MKRPFRRSSWFMTLVRGIIKVFNLYISGLLAATGPFQHIFAVWLVLRRRGQDGYAFAFNLSVFGFLPCPSGSS